MWEGYVKFADTEVVNVARTEHLAQDQPWFRALYEDSGLERFVSDMSIEAAPWYDQTVPESKEFLGLYPLELAGHKDSTRVGTVVENTSDGGSLAGLRHRTREIGFSGALLATSHKGAEYGIRWLRKVLLGDCDAQYDQRCANTGRLEFLPTPFEDLPALAPTPALFEGDVTSDAIADGGKGPDIATATWTADGGDATATGYLPDDFPLNTESVQGYLNSYLEVAFTTGPVVTKSHRLNCGAVVQLVTFTGSVLNPHAWGPDHWAAYQIGTGIAALGEGVIQTSETVSHVDCSTPTVVPFSDPTCPAVLPPPLVPDMPSFSCVELPTDWNRNTLTVPDSYFQKWTDYALTIRVRAPEFLPVRNVRVQAFAQYATPCEWTVNGLISYVPPGVTVVIDGVRRAVYFESSTGVQRADWVLTDQSGGPYSWNLLRCGTQFTITLDTPTIETAVPVYDVVLTPRYI